MANAAEAGSQNSLCDPATVDKKAPREASVRAAAQSASDVTAVNQIPADAWHWQRHPQVHRATPFSLCYLVIMSASGSNLRQLSSPSVLNSNQCFGRKEAEIFIFKAFL